MEAQFVEYEIEQSFPELQVTAGNIAWRIWQAMPEPKVDYISWYYNKRNQSLSEALEGYAGKGGDNGANE